MNSESKIKNMEILTYVLHGMWNTPDNDGVMVIGVSTDLEPLLGELNKIADSRAQGYVEMNGCIQEERSERYYEATDENGKYAKFYITEHWMELPKNMMGEISREQEKIDKITDVKQYLRDMYEEGNIPAWQYEYMTREPKVMQKILQMFNKREDCNTSYNTTMDNVIRETLKNIVLNDEILEFLWEEFGDVLIDDDECILDDFIGFECGTHREAVWHWFDERYSGGVAKLMFGGE